MFTVHLRAKAVARRERMSEAGYRLFVAWNPRPKVCPAPCEAGCNRNQVDDFVGINAVEQFIGDTAFQQWYRFEEPPELSGKRVAIVGGGPAGLSAAYQLRRRGHASTVFEMQDQLGGMFRYGIPGYRTPRDILDREIERITELDAIDVRTGVRIGRDLSIEELEAEFDSVLWAGSIQHGSNAGERGKGGMYRWW